MEYLALQTPVVVAVALGGVAKLPEQAVQV
jgi:hypothetical protein